VVRRRSTRPLFVGISWRSCKLTANQQGFAWRHTYGIKHLRVIEVRSAKPLFVGSIPLAHAEADGGEFPSGHLPGSELGSRQIQRHKRHTRQTAPVCKQFRLRSAI
jgi:hypothetical protein